MATKKEVKVDTKTHTPTDEDLQNALEETRKHMKQLEEKVALAINDLYDAANIALGAERMIDNLEERYHPKDIYLDPTLAHIHAFIAVYKALRDTHTRLTTELHHWVSVIKRSEKVYKIKKLKKDDKK